jgi:hypothetical protein
MPFKSKAQRRKFAELLVKGEISPETYEEWNRDTGRAELPERVTPRAGKTSGKKKKKRTAGSAKSAAPKRKRPAARKGASRKTKARPRRPSRKAKRK